MYVQYLNSALVLILYLYIFLQGWLHAPNFVALFLSIPQQKKQHEIIIRGLLDSLPYPIKQCDDDYPMLTKGLLQRMHYTIECRQQLLLDRRKIEQLINLCQATCNILTRHLMHAKCILHFRLLVFLHIISSLLTIWYMSSLLICSMTSSSSYHAKIYILYFCTYVLNSI